MNKEEITKNMTDFAEEFRVFLDNSKTQDMTVIMITLGKMFNIFVTQSPYSYEQILEIFEEHDKEFLKLLENRKNESR